MAARSLGTLTLDLVARIGGFSGPIDQAARETEAFKKKVEKVSKAAALAGVGVAAGFSVMVKASIDAQDELSKASQMVGVSVENLSALKYTADLAGVGLSDLTSTLGKLNKGLAEEFLKGGGAVSDTLADIGVQTKDANGNLRGTYDIFEEIAGQFAKIDDGALKSKLSMDLFGKSGAALIPLLNGGAQGLRESAIEAARVGKVYSTEAAKGAEEFNDNLSRLQSSLSGVADIVAGNIIGDMAELTGIFADKETQEGIASMATGIVTLGKWAVKAAAGIGGLGKEIGEYFARMQGYTDGGNIEHLRERLVELNDALNFGGGAFLTDNLTKEFTAERKIIESQIKFYEEAEAKRVLAFASGLQVTSSPAKESGLTAEQIKANAAKREADEKAKKDREDANKKAIEDNQKLAQELQKNFEDTRANLQKEIDLYGLSSATALQAYEAKNGSLKALSVAQKEELAGLAKINDLREVQNQLAQSQREVDLAAMGDNGQLASVQFEYDLKKGIIVLNDQISEQQKQQLIDNKRAVEKTNLVATMAEYLKQQERSIALYGITSSAAQLEYDIKNNIIKVEGGINSAQAQQALQNQKRIDSLQEFKSVTELTAEAAERVDAAFADAWKNIDDGFIALRDNIVGGFKTMLAEMAHQALTKPIIMQVQQSITGGAAQTGGSALGAAGAMGGIYAAGALAVIAAVGVWNKQQDEKFLKMTAEYKQANQSLSAVLGSGNKKSETIAKSIQSLSSINDDVLNVNYNMLGALLDIRAGIGDVSAGFAKTLVGGSDYKAMGLNEGTSGANGKYTNAAIVGGIWGVGVKSIADWIGGDIGGFVNGIIDGIGGAIYNKKQKVIDDGIQILGGSLSEIMAGGTLQALNYADLKTTKKFLGVKTSVKVKRSTEDLDDTFEQQISDVFLNAGEALKIASDAFGINFDNYVNQLTIKSQDLSLKGLEGDALAKEIESFFGATLDNWADVLLTGTTVLQDFQNVGESAFDTMLRLSTETKTFNQYAELMALNFKSVGMESIYAVQGLADLSGGFDKLSGSLEIYYDKFFSESDKFNALQKSIGSAYAELGVALPKTREEFKALISGLNLASAAEQEQFAALIKLSGATDQYIAALEKENDAKKEALKASVNSAFDIFTAAVEKQRSAVQEKVDAANAALASSKAVTDSLTSALKSMQLQTSQNQLTTRRAAQAQLITAAAIARAGGPLPLSGQLDDALSVLAQPSQNLYASFEEYARDFYSTSKNIQELAALTGGQQTIDQQNLDVLNSQLTALDDLVEYYKGQVEQLENIDSGVASISVAINNLTQTLQEAGVVGAVVKAVPALDANYDVVQSTKQAAVAVNNAQVIGVSYSDLVQTVTELAEQLEDSQYAIAKNTLSTFKVLDRWESDGLPPAREVIS